MSKRDKKSSKPEWAQKFEDRGREYSETNKESRGGNRFFRHIFAIVWLGLIFYFLNKYWVKIPFLTDDFKAVLWLFNISLAFTALSNFLQALSGSYILKHLLRLMENAISFVVFYTAYIVFPFTASGHNILVIKVVMVFIMFGIGIGAIVEFFKIIGGKNS